MRTPLIAVGPGPAPQAAEEAIARGGGLLADPADAEGLLWLDWRDTDALAALTARAPTLRWVQLPWAGVEHYVEAGVLDPRLTWTCAKGAYGPEVAEHALALALALLRSLKVRSQAISWNPSGAPDPGTLYGARVVIAGGGGIAAALLEQLRPFGVQATVIRRKAEPLAGAARTLGPDRLLEALAGARMAFVALALTPQTRHLIGAEELDALGPGGYLVNVARGAHVDTDALVDALRTGRLGGAALDVTDPEPLPDGHPLWGLPNCLITPHVANPVVGEANDRLLALFSENIGRLARGENLLGKVDVELGY